jgi:hypothetical protein
MLLKKYGNVINNYMNNKIGFYLKYFVLQFFYKLLSYSFECVMCGSKLKFVYVKNYN